MPVNRIRVASWNLRRGRAGLELLKAQGPALVLAQEVTAGAFTELRRRFDWGVYSLDLWGDHAREIPPNKHGVAVMGSSELAPGGATWWSLLSRRGRCSSPTSR